MQISNQVIGQTANLEDIPEHAIVLSKAKAISTRINQIYNHRPRRDLWAVRYGPWLLGAVAVIPGVLVNQHIRRVLKLRGQGFYTMYITGFYVPFLMGIGFHYESILLELVALNPSTCLSCTQMKAGLIQGTISCIYTTLISSTSGFMFASRHGTVDLPYYKDFKGIFNSFIKLLKPLSTKLTVIFIAECILAHYITVKESEQIYNFQINAILNQFSKKKDSH